MSDIERQSLDAHVSLCELRYQSLERRIVDVEDKLESLNTLLLQIRDSLAQLPVQQTQLHYDKWSQFQWWVIGGLSGALGWALARLLAQ